MALTDRARGFHGILIDRFCRQPVVFHHVPKCGGTTVARALRWRYLLSQGTVDPEASFRALAHQTGRSDTERLLLDVHAWREYLLHYLLEQGVRCVAAHVHYRETERAACGNRYKFITLLREPVSRLLSHFNWNASRPQGHAHIADDFDSFLDSPRAALLGAEYAAYFADLPGDADIRTAEAVDRAVVNLRRFDLVGRLDDLQGFALGLRRELGVRLRFGHENRSSPRPDAVRWADLTEAQRDRVKQLCAPDIAIWNAIFPACAQGSAPGHGSASTVGPRYAG